MKIIVSLRGVTLAKRISFIFLVLVFAFDILCNASVHDSNKANPTLLIVNHAPVFNKSSYNFSVSEDIALGSSAGTVSATDADGDHLSYSFKSGNTNSILAINASTGSITVAKHLNHHTQDSFVLVVKVADPGGLSNQASVIIKVNEGYTSSASGNISWGTAASQQYTINESQGEVVNGKLYTFGGFDSQKPSFTPTSRAYVFDPAANKWSSLAPMPPMNGTNYGGVTHAGCTNDGTDIYFSGGYTSNSSGTGQIYGTKEVWKYIVAENRYVRLPDLPVIIAAGQLEYLAGKLHHISGTNAGRTMDLGDHYVLNLDSLSAGWKKLAPLPNPRQHAGSVVFENKIYYIGGQHGQDDNLIAQKEMDVYNPVTNSWKKLQDLPVPSGATGRGHISSSCVVDGENILVLAGETVHNTGRTNMISSYAPSTNTWQNLTPLPQTRYSGVAANLNGIIYYTGGSKTNITYKSSSSASSTQKIQSLTLVNAETDQLIETLVNGDTLNLATLPTNDLNILATTNPSTVGSVQFNLTGAQNNNSSENGSPYTLFGDTNGDYNEWTPPVGTYTLKATPYSSSNAAGTAGTSETVSFTVVDNPSGEATLLPVSDASVRGGSYADINYGSDHSLNIKGSPSVSYTWYTYLKFSLKNISSISAAKLRLYGNNITNSSAISIYAYGVNDDSWTEGGIEFNNAPASIGSSLSSASVSNLAKYYEFDVTSFVKTQFTGDKTVSLVVKDTKNSGDNFVFNSRENSQNPPQLLITYNAQKSFNANDTQVSNSSISLTKKSGKDLAVLFYDIINRHSKVYPNPMHKLFNIEFANDYKGMYNLQIADPVGKIYDLGNFSLKPGEHHTKVDVSRLIFKPGIYFLRIYSDTKQTEILKLIIE